MNSSFPPLSQQLLDETDELWNEFVQKEFKTPLKPEQFDSWRQYYNFQLAQREHRLKVITAGISSKARKAVPERKTVTIDVKLPREIRRRQERASNPFYSSGGGGSSSGQGRGGSSSYSSNSSGGLGGTAPHSMGGSSNLGGMVTLGANSKFRFWEFFPFYLPNFSPSLLFQSQKLRR